MKFIVLHLLVNMICKFCILAPNSHFPLKCLDDWALGIFCNFMVFSHATCTVSYVHVCTCLVLRCAFTVGIYLLMYADMHAAFAYVHNVTIQNEPTEHILYFFTKRIFPCSSDNGHFPSLTSHLYIGFKPLWSQVPTLIK